MPFHHPGRYFIITHHYSSIISNYALKKATIRKRKNNEVAYIEGWCNSEINHIFQFYHCIVQSICIIFQEGIKGWRHHLCSLLLASNEDSWGFRIFHFLPMMAKKRKLTDEGGSQLLDKSDECRETESSTLDSKNIFLEIKRKYGFRISQSFIRKDTVIQLFFKENTNHSNLLKVQCDSILSSFMMFACQNLLDTKRFAIFKF